MREVEREFEAIRATQTRGANRRRGDAQGRGGGTQVAGQEDHFCEARAFRLHFELYPFIYWQISFLGARLRLRSLINGAGMDAGAAREPEEFCGALNAGGALNARRRYKRVLPFTWL